MTNRTIVIVALMLLTALSMNWFLETNEENSQGETIPKNEPDLYMINAKIKQFDDSGNVQHIITATEFTHYSLSEITDLSVPQVKLYTHTSTPPWIIASSHGRILPGKGLSPEVVELWGNVRASRSYDNGEFVIIEADRLKLTPDHQLVESQSKVSIRDSLGFTSAAGMTAMLDNKRYNFTSNKESRVHSVFEPKSPDSGSGINAK